MEENKARSIFVNNLRTCIKNSDKTYKEVAQGIGVSEPTFHSWVYGKKYPRIDKIEALAHYFGVSVSDLVDKEIPFKNTHELIEKRNVNARISELFEKSNFSLRDLAEAAGCSKSAMQRYISSDRNIPILVVERLASAFDVHPGYLLGWTDDCLYNKNETDDKNALFIEIVEKLLKMDADTLSTVNNIIAVLDTRKKKDDGKPSGRKTEKGVINDLV